MTVIKPESLKKLAVFCPEESELLPSQQLVAQLGIVLYQAVDTQTPEEFFLSYRDGCLKLLDKELLKKGGLMVEIEPRLGEQRSYPAPKQGALVQALGKSKTVVDATTGWGQDSLFMFRMGFSVLCIERSPVMAVLLQDAFKRLGQCDWVQALNLEVPQLLQGNAIELLATLDTPPDCIYLDPMFPPKRKKSALAKKSIQVLHELIGQDEDKEVLFAVALQATGKRVVVKSPDYAEPLGGKPQQSFSGKLVRYDVYLKN
jgi:16S rRNA (guanine1516-N2)-methyltransferase